MSTEALLRGVKVVIPASLAEVFALVSDPAQDPTWRLDVRHAILSGGKPSQVGSTYRIGMTMMGQDIEMVARVVDFELDRHFTVAVAGPGGDMIVTTSVLETAGGAEVTISPDASGLGDMANMAGAMARSSAEKDLRNLYARFAGGSGIGATVTATEVASAGTENVPSASTHDDTPPAHRSTSVPAPRASKAKPVSTEGRSALWHAVHALEPLIRTYAEQMEVDRQIPAELTQALYEAGVFNTFTPKELGGLQSDPLDWLEMVEELSRINGAVGWLAMVNAGMVMVPPDRFDELTNDRTTQWITAGNAGRMGGRARRVEGGYLVSGRWPFTSGAPHANFLGGMSVLYDDDDQVVIHPGDGMPWVVTGTFKREEVTLIDTWDGLGVRGSGSGDFEVKDAFIPASVADRSMKDLMYNEMLFREPMFILTAHGAHAVGLAQAAFDAYIALCNGKKADGSRRQSEMGRQQIHRISVAKADALIRSSRLLITDTVRRVWDEINESEEGLPSLDARAAMCEAMVFSVHQCRDAVDMLFKCSGVSGVFRGTEMERIFRDMMTVSQHIVVTEDRLEEMGQYWITKDSDRPYTPMMLSFSIRTPKPTMAAAS